jgi:hypothetical protein
MAYISLFSYLNFFEETYNQSNCTVSSILQQHPKKADKGDTESSSKKTVSGQKIADKSNGSADSKKAAGVVVYSYSLNTNFH